MHAFPDVLKTWRKARRFSQLQLALEADVSSRHLSFLETGRSRPSREMIGRLGDALQLPLAARNHLLASAGFTSKYPAREWDEETMAPIRAAVAHTLDCHAPYPGIAIDRLWRLVRLNGPARLLFGLLDLHEGDSLLDLLASGGLAGAVVNWPEVAHQTAQRLSVESASQGGVPELERVAAVLAVVPAPERAPAGPVVPMTLQVGDLRLSLFTTIAQFGTPQDVVLDDLKIELYFPADAASEHVLRQLSPARAEPRRP